ncbi:hypothetical protein ACFOOK_18705 [Micromonospora krabiensis]|uniref:Uncharacterized protein n=1 Tax=Micromonospora krabiensis TaxID=307121 RepID=A0A1C3MYW3_9ACTN|nr:hypothetical protein [Micromonospora krabiensis]SBV25522.1 hypothetical protein GA0070620_0999 [Micromonospora krabiensis]
MTSQRVRTLGRRLPALTAVGLPWALLLLWLLWAGLAWWSAPREVPVDELDRDLAAGRVITFQRTDGWNDDALWGDAPEPRYGADQGGVVAWTLPNGQVRYTYDGGPQGWSDPGPSARDARLTATAQVWRADGAPAHRVSDAAVLTAMAIGLIWLFVLVNGRPPRVGTRWYWFWVGLLPFGVGVLAWVYRERWRPAPERAARHSGWWGLCVLILGAIGLSVLVAGLRALLGGTVVPG